MSFKYNVSSQAETGELAAKLAPSLKGRIIFLNGGLGAGKTTFVKYLAKYMGFEDEVSSPTFSIANKYRSNDSVMIHFDLYRLQSEAELEMTGFYEMIEESATIIIEWAEKFDLALYIKKHIDIKITVHGDTSREFEIKQ